MRRPPDVGPPGVVVAPGDRLALRPELPHGGGRLLGPVEEPALVGLDQELVLVGLRLLAGGDPLLGMRRLVPSGSVTLGVHAPADLSTYDVLRDAHLVPPFTRADGRRVHARKVAAGSDGGEAGRVGWATGGVEDRPPTEPRWGVQWRDRFGPNLGGIPWEGLASLRCSWSVVSSVVREGRRLLRSRPGQRASTRFRSSPLRRSSTRSSS